MALKVLIVAEYYPRALDAVSGIWAHRQALATRDAAAGDAGERAGRPAEQPVELRVLVLHRPLPSLASIRALDLPAAARALRQPAHADLDGLAVDYVRYLSPPRPWSYASWGAWAAPWLRHALKSVRTTFPFDLIHAHYGVPAGDAVRRAVPGVPLVVSVHGHDVYGAGARSANVHRTLAHARLVVANSVGTARRCEALGARQTRVIHLGADLPPPPGAGTQAPAPSSRAPQAARAQTPTLVTLGHLVSRKRHADVICALALLRDRGRDARYVIVGDGPERESLRTLARALHLDDRVELRGQLPHAQAVATIHAGSLFVLPSVEEAFGVAYIEAMAGGVPAIGCRNESGPEEIAAAGGGIALVAPRNAHALADRIDALLSDRPALARMGAQARATVEREFTWRRCGRETRAAYRATLAAYRNASDQ
ncbi:MAG: glycosyltransferase [Solirubrobacteraceae bacterium]